MTTATTKRSTVVGVFENVDAARRAIEALKQAGFTGEHISVLAPDRGDSRELAEETGTKAGEGAATGAVTGGILGGLAGWLVGIGALAIPGVGPFIAAGALATALGGAAIGAGVGAIAGALVGMGIPEEEAKYYEGEVKSGRTLVTVSADGRYDEAQRILRQHGAYDIESRGQAGTTAATTRAAATAGKAETDLVERRSVQLREEELQARKTPVETGQVSVGKEVVEEQKTLEVPVKREEVYVERRPVDRPADRPIDTADQQTVEVPVREERVDVSKQPVVYEEVGVQKQQVVENQPVSGTVRREELRVDKEGDVRMGAGAGTTATGWQQAMPTYRQRWQQRYGSTGGRWEEAEPGYRYGYDLRNRPEYRGRSWSDVESQAQRDWSTRNPNTPWDRVKESVRESWESAT
jgi:uncharacterized protein (TIGR02271 family)